jgi:hypothetical protein
MEQLNVVKLEALAKREKVEEENKKPSHTNRQ